MKKTILLTLTLIAFLQLTFAQKTPTQLKKKMTLQMPRKAEDEFSGTRGAAVVWNPKTKRYYASYAGNGGFPMAVFTKKGKRVSNDDLTTQMDTRGLWYNKNNNQIEGNAYSDNGWFYYELDKEGIPTTIQTIFEGMYQPDEQSFGMYNPIDNMVFFKGEDNLVSIYNRETGEEADLLYLYKGDDEDEIDFSQYRSSIVIVDGELGLLNDQIMQIDFFSDKNGKHTRSAKLPEGTKIADLLSFSYANGYIWILDDETRSWNGFKL
ncbi:MAG: hypothetical protein FGM46_05015 [Ferruginibacter sp.]|nr:hypothetical protein [Ferruginibacter sp.]